MKPNNYPNRIAARRLRLAWLTRAPFALALIMLVFAVTHAQTPQSSLPTSQVQSDVNVAPLSLDEAVRLALLQASTFQQAVLNERVAAEDVRQSRAAFLPRLDATSSVIYTSPAIGVTTPPGTPRVPSFIAANAIAEYQALVGVAGELDISGRLRATLRRNVALLEAARAGTEVARRALIQATNDAYLSLALATARKGAAEETLVAAEEFERITSLLLQGGEVAPVDLVRAQLQTNTRRDDLELARANETVAADALRVLVGYGFTQPIATTDLLLTMPEPGEIERFTTEMISRRPEFAQFEAERRAVKQDVKIARAERRPQVTYAINGGFDTSSLRPPPIRENTGGSATVGVTIPIFDWGASKSRERQANLRAQIAESTRLVALRGFAQQFYDARAQALAAVTRIRLASAGVIKAESNLQASIARYRAGEAQIIEVTDAQNTLIAQRTAFYQAIFDYQAARTRLMQATGR
jgi:outer membrane protein